MLPTAHSCAQVCIHQTDQSLKEAGVFGLAGILKHSKRMVVLWRPRYFSRVWCVYEALPWFGVFPSSRAEGTAHVLNCPTEGFGATFYH